MLSVFWLFGSRSPRKLFYKNPVESAKTAVCCKTEQISRVNHTKSQAFNPPTKISQLQHDAKDILQQLLH